jgi:hypothetical protein
MSSCMDKNQCNYNDDSMWKFVYTGWKEILHEYMKLLAACKWLRNKLCAPRAHNQFENVYPDDDHNTFPSLSNFMTWEAFSFFNSTSYS